MKEDEDGDMLKETKHTNPEELKEATIEGLRKELKEQENKYLLLLAEIENTRKRMQKEKHDMTRFSVENVIMEFLSPLDNFENALGFSQKSSEEVQKWAKGFEMIHTQFKDVLASHKVSPFQSEGMNFDPHLHEVIEIEETEKHEEGMIIQEFLRGYKCNDRVIRPARVKIAKGSKEKESSNQEKINIQGENKDEQEEK